MQENYEKLKKRFIDLGGAERLLRSLRFFSWANEAKLKYEIRRLEQKQTQPAAHAVSSPQKQEPSYQPKADFQDFILNYPPDLHPTFIARKNYFLQACSLKIQLNELPENEPQKAAELQWKIWQLFQMMDKMHTALKHWQLYKRILPTQNPHDLSHIPPTQLDLKRRNLRSNRTRRAQTLHKLQQVLPPPNHPNYPRAINLINKKKEELALLDLQIEKLTQMIGKI